MGAKVPGLGCRLLRVQGSSMTLHVPKCSGLRPKSRQAAVDQVDHRRDRTSEHVTRHETGRMATGVLAGPETVVDAIADVQAAEVSIIRCYPLALDDRVRIVFIEHFANVGEQHGYVSQAIRNENASRRPGLRAGKNDHSQGPLRVPLSQCLSHSVAEALAQRYFLGVWSDLWTRQCPLPPRGQYLDDDFMPLVADVNGRPEVTWGAGSSGVHSARLPVAPCRTTASASSMPHTAIQLRRAAGLITETSSPACTNSCRLPTRWLVTGTLARSPILANTTRNAPLGRTCSTMEGGGVFSITKRTTRRGSCRGRSYISARIRRRPNAPNQESMIFRNAPA